MDHLRFSFDEGTLTCFLSGRIDSSNAQELEKAIADERAGHPVGQMVLDFQDLEYISSAGLRIVLRLKKALRDTSIVNASQEVWDILELTGFTEMMEVRRAYRTISTEGCEVIGTGSNGYVCRMDRETVVKVYRDQDALAQIRHEQELSRTAFILGLPTAIPYDVVRIREGGYGSVFELLDATSLAELLRSGKLSVEEAAEQSIELLKTIHATSVQPGSMPDMRFLALNWADFLKDHLPAEHAEKLHALIASMPEDMHMLHGDYHINNLLMQNGEILLVDMDTLCHGHPVFELASMYNSYIGYKETDPSESLRFFGIPEEVSGALWDRSLHLYCAGADEETLRAISEKAQILGYARAMRRRIRRNGLNSEQGRAEIENCRKHLLELLPRHDTLLF